MRHKYPKTLHFPWSPGLQNDDRMMSIDAVIANFEGNEVVMTEKLDGENTSMYQNGIHARSLDSAHHLSRSWVKQLHGSIKDEIPEGWRICGENMFAYHSIFYRNLKTYFYVFNIWDENNVCLSIDDTIEWCNLLNLEYVPILYRGHWNADLIQSWDLDFVVQEGYVVRNTHSFNYKNFQQNVAKYVRRGHVQTDEHWMNRPVVKNLLYHG